MNCENMLEYLPFRANGTLSGEKKTQVDAHLAGCDACRRELEATHLAAEIYAAHPSPDELWQLAMGEPVSAAITTHTASCASCAEELAMIQDSQATLTEADVSAAAPHNVVRGPWSRSPMVRYALAAGLALAVLGPVLLTLTKGGHGGSQVAGRVIDLPVEVMRGGAETPSELMTVSRAEPRVTLTLGANKPALWTGFNLVVVVLTDEAGRELKRQSVTMDNRIGAVQLPVKTADLPLGRVTITAYTQEREPLAETQFRVVP